jgi:hypothetical protein
MSSVAAGHHELPNPTAILAGMRRNWHKRQAPEVAHRRVCTCNALNWLGFLVCDAMARVLMSIGTH